MRFILLIVLIYSIPKANSQSIEIQKVFVEGGKFLMGCDTSVLDQKPAHKVFISDFYVSACEITNEQFVIFLNKKGNLLEDKTYWINLQGKWREQNCRIIQKNDSFIVEKGFEKFPVTYVSWYGAARFAEWAGGRLITEAEWEFIASKSSANIENTWFIDNSELMPHAVGALKPDGSGIYDIYGNVAEWCADYYNKDFYNKKKRKNPVNNLKSDFRCIRGGSWISEYKSLNCKKRNGANPNNNEITTGFRVVFPVHN